jgi:hypothetical protein
MNLINNNFTWMAKVTPNISIASKNAIITWQGTHWSLMKFMTNPNVSHPNLDIHRLEEAMVVANVAIFLSVIFDNITNKCSFINCFDDGKSHLQSQCKTKHRRSGFSTTNKGMYPFLPL